MTELQQSFSDISQLVDSVGPSSEEQIPSVPEGDEEEVLQGLDAKMMERAMNGATRLRLMIIAEGWFLVSLTSHLWLYLWLFRLDLIGLPSTRLVRRAKLMTARYDCSPHPESPDKIRESFETFKVSLEKLATLPGKRGEAAEEGLEECRKIVDSLPSDEGVGGKVE